MADDSYEHGRSVRDVSVYYEGTAPNCRIESKDATGTPRNSAALIPDPYTPRVLKLASPLSTGLEKTLSLQCDLPPSTVILGYLVNMSATRKSTGT